jgi:hypothetical protein
MALNLPEPNKPPEDAAPAVPAVASVAADALPARRTPTTPPFRRLRSFAFDPLLSTQLDTLSVNQVTLPVIWEEDLSPGPVGEYLEIVDWDPAGGCCYAPVDLNSPHLLATDGLAPSEGNPLFHQQMVYAVAMTTIRHFEQALGRKAQWAPQERVEDGKEAFVGRLRIYPHGLREANAYYSPVKKALLFGYFPASAAAPGRNLPGGMVFTCLSHDVIAHETTHALLDGMHHRFIEPSNPDMLALHEAFADLVALFQHFTFPDVLRQQIGRTRGNLADQNLLGQLAQQFGEAVGRYGALRDALGSVNPATGRWEPQVPDPAAYQATPEPHARGAILVAAVFEAFLSIYKNRIADLLRIATAGSGVLPAGELHPDLVNRLANEAAKSARHILTMCIRALDYCPPADLTFGEYLRALITADTDLVHDDDLGYRVAVIDAFRRRGLYPRSVRSLAADSLLWREPEELIGRTAHVDLFRLHAHPLLDQLNDWNLSGTREELFKEACELRDTLKHWFVGLRAADANLLEELTGLALTATAPGSLTRDADGLPEFEVQKVQPARRVGPDGQLVQNLIVELTQERAGFRDPARQAQADGGRLPSGAVPDFTFRGGCTIIFDLETALPRYFIVKRILSEPRLQRQRDFVNGPSIAPLRATYFGAAGNAEPFALLHRDG